jgi:hypothetical protein
MFIFRLLIACVWSDTGSVDPYSKVIAASRYSFTVQSLTNKTIRMERVTRSIIFTLAFGLFCVAAHSQERTETAEQSTKLPKWLSGKGYWVVVQNIHQRGECTVHFYNNDHQEVYKETVLGKFRVNNRKTRLQMKSILETAVIAWERNQPLSSDDKLFAAEKKK